MKTQKKTVEETHGLKVGNYTIRKENGWNTDLYLYLREVTYTDKWFHLFLGPI